MELLVTVQIAGKYVPAGRLFQNVRNGAETASFSYVDGASGNRGACLQASPGERKVSSSIGAL